MRRPRRAGPTTHRSWPRRRGQTPMTGQQALAHLIQPIAEEEHASRDEETTCRRGRLDPTSDHTNQTPTSGGKGDRDHDRRDRSPCQVSTFRPDAASRVTCCSTGTSTTVARMKSSVHNTDTGANPSAPSARPPTIWKTIRAKCRDQAPGDHETRAGSTESVDGCPGARRRLSCRRRRSPLTRSCAVLAASQSPRVNHSTGSKRIVWVRAAATTSEGAGLRSSHRPATERQDHHNEAEDIR